MQNKRPSFKAALLARKFSLGTWLSLGHPSIAEILVQAGYDWIVVDNEHSMIPPDQIQNLLSIIQANGAGALVRLSHNQPIEVRKVLDAGATGVICPMINSAEDAKQLVAAAKYPPLGRRSYGLSRAQTYGTRSAEYFAQANDDTVVIAQIEHIDGVRNIDAILAVPGLDGVMMGPYDLSGSLNLPGQLDHPTVLAAEKEILAKSAARGLACGAHLVHPTSEQIRAKLALGYTFLAVGVDFIYLGEGARAAHAEALSQARSRT